MSGVTAAPRARVAWKPASGCRGRHIAQIGDAFCYVSLEESGWEWAVSFDRGLQAHASGIWPSTDADPPCALLSLVELNAATLVFAREAVR